MKVPPDVQVKPYGKLYDFGIVKVHRFIYANPGHDDRFNVFLPHSCDDWEVGSTVDEIMELVNQLNAAKRLIQETPTKDQDR